MELHQLPYSLFPGPHHNNSRSFEIFCLMIDDVDITRRCSVQIFASHLFLRLVGGRELTICRNQIVPIADGNRFAGGLLMMLTLQNADLSIYLLRLEGRRPFAETTSDCHLEYLIREVGHFQDRGKGNFNSNRNGIVACTSC